MNYLGNKIEGSNYKLKFNWCYIECNNFKEKDLLILRNSIGGARLGKEIHFYKYANITFDENDKRHDVPIVTELDNFARGKTNAIIYIMNETETNPGKFDRCLIYQTTLKNDGFYGYVFYNTQTGRYTHIYNVTWDRNDLLIHIWRSIDTLQREELYDYYMTRCTGGVRQYKRYSCFPNTPPADKMHMNPADINWAPDNK